MQKWQYPIHNSIFETLYLIKNVEYTIFLQPNTVYLKYLTKQNE